MASNAILIATPVPDSRSGYNLEIRGRPAGLALRFFGLDHFASRVVAAVRAHDVGLLGLMAV